VVFKCDAEQNPDEALQLLIPADACNATISCQHCPEEVDMNSLYEHTGNATVSMTLFAGAGLATLPTVTHASLCMMKKAHGMIRPMCSHVPHYHPSMSRHSYGPQRHATKHRDYAVQKHAIEAIPAPAEQAATQAAAESGPDIIETAAAAKNFKTLIRAAEAAGLYDTLRGDGPFTVFAPSDAAFASLPQGALDSLLANPDRLVPVLTYHVVPERLTAADLLQRRKFTTLQGQTLSIDKLAVATADFETSNGIVHVIDTVLMPAP
jgi:uncharacterized surface protein with fasciclin (FAS1) repeats